MARFVITNIFLTSDEKERMNKIRNIIIEQINRNQY